MIDASTLARRVESILNDYKNRCTQFAGQPEAFVRSQIIQHFDAAANDISRYLKSELD